MASAALKSEPALQASSASSVAMPGGAMAGAAACVAGAAASAVRSRDIARGFHGRSFWRSRMEGLLCWRCHPDYAPHLLRDVQTKAGTPVDGRSGFLRPRQALQMVEVGGSSQHLFLSS